MIASLPPLSSFEAFQAWRTDTLDIAHGHGLKPASPYIFTTGTNLVIGLGDELILKIFPPVLRDKFLSERASLDRESGGG